MGKVRKIWNENKVLLVLAIILVICIAIVIVVSIKYFYGSSNNVYGNRLDITKEVEISDKLLSDIKDTLNSSEGVSNTVVTLKGKIIYVNIEYKSGTGMEKAKEIASKVLPLFNEKELSVYDIEFSITEGDAYTLMGARNANGKQEIVWNNYNIDNLDDTETKKESKES